MKKVLILACTLSSVVFAQQSNPPDATIRLDVNLILANATVFDKAGEAITDLDQKAFRLFVDGQQQNITVFQKDDSPVTAGIIVDNSASMTPKGSEVLAAALAFARASNPQDQMFVVHFSDQVRMGLPEQVPFTGSIPELESALSRFSPSGTTALYDALGLAFSHLHQATFERKVLLVISDGGDNSSKTNLKDVLKLAKECGYVIYTIGIYDSGDRDSNPEVLRELAELTGGKAYFPLELNDVNRIAVEIAQEIRKQYTIGFEGQEDGRYHNIRVTAQNSQRGELAVRTRAGYYGPPRPGGGGQ